ncbi:MAG: hypothetical protein AAB319_07460 [Pseudomonadota bacterium]
MSIHNAPPADSAAAARVLRAALERDSTVLVVAPVPSADLQTTVYHPVKYWMDVSYRADRPGERLVLKMFSVETGEILLQDSVRFTGPARSLVVPPLGLPNRPPTSRW